MDKLGGAFLTRNFSGPIYSIDGHELTCIHRTVNSERFSTQLPDRVQTNQEQHGVDHHYVEVNYCSGYENPCRACCLSRVIPAAGRAFVVVYHPETFVRGDFFFIAYCFRSRTANNILQWSKISTDGWR